MTDVKWCGREIKTAVMLYRFHLPQHLRDHVDGSDERISGTIANLFKTPGRGTFLTDRLKRCVVRQAYDKVRA